MYIYIYIYVCIYICIYNKCSCLYHHQMPEECSIWGQVETNLAPWMHVLDQIFGPRACAMTRWSFLVAVPRRSEDFSLQAACGESATRALSYNVV